MNPLLGGSRAGPGFGRGSQFRLSYITPPPDLAQIPSEVAVPFKNLLKRDSITKQKALEDIVAYVKGFGGKGEDIPDSVLVAWVELYPRTAIDNARRVRELSHSILHEMALRAEKRIKKMIGPIIGAWLAGSFDRDRAVARAATLGFEYIAPTEQQRTEIWGRAQKLIVDYALEAISETSETLSDERFTNKEDAEAKFNRVVASSMSLITRIVQTTDCSKIERQLSEYLANKALWKMSTAEDSSVRRSYYALLAAFLDKNSELLRPQLGQMGQSLIRQALRGNQTGSAVDLLKVLCQVNKLFPEIWGEKRSPYELIIPSVEKGSQGSNQEYWLWLRDLSLNLPGQPLSAELAGKFLNAVRKGISSRGEPPAHSSVAWSSYLSIFEKLVIGFTPDTTFLQGNIFPFTEQYLLPSPDLTGWKSPLPPTALRASWDSLCRHPDPAVQTTLRSEWERLAGLFMQKLEASRPEVAKDYEKSQETIAEAGNRWFALVKALMEDPSPQLKETLADTLAASCRKIIDATCDELMRDFKSFGAASIFKAGYVEYPGRFPDGKGLMSVIPMGNSAGLKALVDSKSLAYLVPCLEKLAATQPGQFEAAWNELIGAAVELQDLKPLTLLIATPSAQGPARRQSKVQDHLLSIMEDCAQGRFLPNDDPGSWALFEKAVKLRLIDDAALLRLAESIIRIIPQAQHPHPPIRALEILARNAPQSIQDPDLQLRLTTNMVAVLEKKPVGTVVEDAVKSIRAELNSSSVTPSIIQALIHQNLHDASSSSLQIDTILHEYLDLRSHAIPVESLLPDTGLWLRELGDVMAIPDPSLSLTSRLGGAYFLVRNDAKSNLTPSSSKRDAEGRSIPARMALFVSRLISSVPDLSDLPLNRQVEILYLLGVTIELAEDQMIMAKNGLWSPISDAAVLVEIELFIEEGRKVFDSIAEKLTNSDWREAELDFDSLAARLVKVTVERIKSLSPLAFYSSKLLSNTLEKFSDAQGPPTKYESWLQTLSIMKAKPETAFAAAAFLVGLRSSLADSPSVTRLCRTLFAELGGAEPGAQATLLQTVLSNACMTVYDKGDLPVPSRNQVLVSSRIGRWFETPEEMSAALSAETYKLVLKMLPTIKTQYGTWWAALTSHCLRLWTEEAAKDPRNESLPYLQASLKLIMALELEDEVSDDLSDALVNSHGDRSRGLLELLKLPRDPEMLKLPGHGIFDDLLCRVVEKIPLEHIQGTSEGLYPLLASDSRSIQTATFRLLQKLAQIPQDEVIMDLLLEKETKEIDLPQGLLKIISEVPPHEAWAEDLESFPNPVRSYLLAWLLIFDAYATAPFKLQEAYTACLKKHGSFVPFLDFVFDVLGHSSAAALELDKEGLTDEHIKVYDIKAAGSEEEEKDMNWLLVHLCYLALRYLPGAFRAWYLECSSKQTKLAVESWVRKHMSPTLISEALDQVAKWDSEQDDGDEQKLNVSLYRSAREVVAQYEIDDEVAGIVISIPAGYPIETVEVRTLKRVAVVEKQWKAWLATTQATITFSNGTIADGLGVFRSNIVAALKGQTECAICYSIVASDKRLPDKQCQTCKHLFHRICLYKWIQTSSQNTCPLCRNPINLLGGGKGKR
ncbi:E3 ubiquitin-protein ligase listerin [Naviculisporaceae sp. PSN 640]